MSYFKILGLTELGLVGIHAAQLLSSNLDYTQSLFWWLSIHSIMIYFVFTEFYSEVENNAETTIRSFPLKKKTEAKSEAPEEPWYKPLLNMCTIDHSLLLDDENENTDENSSTTKQKST